MNEKGGDYPQLAAQVERLTGEVEELQRRVRSLEIRASQDVHPRPNRQNPFGLVAINRIGALTLAISVIFFFKYAVDNQWIGPGMRIASGLIGGAALLAAGEWLRRRAQPVLAQGVAGCGLATLYITCYAAFAWYRLLSEVEAALALILVSAVAVMLSLRYAHAAIAALGLAGGLLTPMLLKSEQTGLSVTLPYLLLIEITCVVIVHERHWLGLIPLTAGETMVAALFLTPAARQDWVVALTLFLAVIHIGAAAITPTGKRIKTEFRATAQGFIIVGLLREIDLWTRRALPEPARMGAESEFGSLFLAGYGIAALAYGVAYRSPLARTMGLCLVGAVIAKLYLWDVWYLQRLYRMSAFGALGLLLLTASWIYSRARDPH